MKRAAATIRDYGSLGAAAVHLASGEGEGHVWGLHLEPGGVIGPTPPDPGSSSWWWAGRGWVAGEDGTRYPLAAGEGAYIYRGEVHSKGSETGMTAIMVQLSHLVLRSSARARPPAE